MPLGMEILEGRRKISRKITTMVPSLSFKRLGVGKCVFVFFFFGGGAVLIVLIDCCQGYDPLVLDAG